IDPPSGGGGGGGGGGGNGGGEPPTGFAIRSSSFSDGGAIPARYASASCGGENLSPEIAIHNTPPGTVGHILLMDDPDGGGAVHWAAWNIPPDVTSIPEGNPGNIGVAGKNGFGQIGYTGPCPPAGETHTYRIRIWALPLLVEMEPGTDVTPLLGMLDQIGDFTLGSAEYRGAFGQ
ncbi:MAG: YbhB/YbcL family Raf kinase inhibitor-like protein, partial [bacterium]|nr:YbhB/YbcL family Raf kinase inhibitor-like protein [bacterium]